LAGLRSEQRHRFFGINGAWCSNPIDSTNSTLQRVLPAEAV